MDLTQKFIWIDLVFSLLFIAAVFFFLGKAKHTLKLSGRLPAADFLKGIAIISVVLIHTSTIAPIGSPLNPYLGFGVELFILCSGYLLARRYARGLELGDYLGKIFWRIIVIYALFVAALHLYSHGMAISLADLALDLFFGRPLGNLYYFIPVILQLYLIFPLIRSRMKNRLVLFLALALSLVWAYADAQIRVPDWNSDPLVLSFAGRYLFFFLFGIFLSSFDLDAIGRKTSGLLSAAYMAGAAAITVMAGEAFFGYLYAIFALFALLLAHHAAKKSGVLARMVGLLGRQSLLVYLAHGIVLKLAFGAIPVGLGGAAGYIFFAFATLAICSLFAEAFMRLYRKITGFSSVA